jgi:hypothetical protein
MRLSAFIIAALLLPVCAAAQTSVTVRPEPKSDVWWLRAEFHPRDTEIRGIPVNKIRAHWGRAGEFTPDMFPAETLVENGYDHLKETGLSFSVQGSFDGSRLSQTALIGVYETCARKKGRFFLIFDTGTKRVRFLDTDDSAKEQFAVIGSDGRTLHIFYCLECDNVSTVRWDRARKRFVMR